VRRLALLSLTALFAPVLVLLPTAARPAPRPHPVRAQVHSPGVAAGARLATFEHTNTFSALAVTWAGTGVDAASRPVDVLVRTRTAGRWTRWSDLGGDSDNSPDARSAELRRRGVRAGTALAYPGPSNGVQVRLRGHAVHDVRIELIDPGHSSADAALGQSPTLGDASADAALPQPKIYSRADWGADESIKTCFAGYTSTITMGFIHHTDTPNDYDAAGAARWIRSLYAYHVQSRGWCDLGYNFVIDMFGRIFEGRAGGITKPVLGAHTGGFNSKTFGVALLGTFVDVTPPAAMQAAVVRLFSWKFSLYGVNPRGTTTLVSQGGGTAKYADGVSHTFDNVSGHRDAGNTECPGNAAYALLPGLRSKVQTKPVGAEIHDASVSPKVQAFALGTAFTVRARFPRKQQWLLTVMDSHGKAVRRYGGAHNGAISVAWDMRDGSGLPVLPADYHLQLRAWISGSAARPWSANVTITAPV
jgi:hypothetical protein